MKPTIRASSVDRLLACFGSHAMTEKYWAAQPFNYAGDQDGDEMSWRGNWCHWESARRLIRDHGAVCVGGLPRRPEVPAGFQPGFWDVMTVEWYVAAVLERTPPDHLIIVEMRLTMEFARFFLTGGIDVHTISPDGTTFTLGDLKTGPNPVDAAGDNWQVASYVVLLANHYPSLIGGKARIYQKLVDDQVTEVEVVELADVRGLLERRINEALDRSLELETGYKQCRLCPCIEFCPAIQDELTDMKKTLTPEQFNALVVTPDLKQLGDLAQRGRALSGPVKRLLDKFKERVSSEGAVTLSDGTTCEIVDALGDRKITAPKVAFAFVAKEIGEDEAWETAKLSLAEIENQLVKVKDMQRGSKDPEKPTAQRWIKQNLSHVIRRDPTKELVWK
jgi:hypothetical protein